MKYALVNGNVLDATLNAAGTMEVHKGWALLVDKPALSFGTAEAEE